MISSIAPFCISAYIIYKELDRAEYLMIRRSGRYLPGTWQMVSGGIHDGETAPQAAIREIHEETGIKISKFYSADAVETFYFPPKDKVVCVPVFAAFVEAKEPIVLSPSEHDAFEWLSFEEAKKRLIWSEQKRVITLIHENFVLNEPLDWLLMNQ